METAFANHQWAVTERGLESIERGFPSYIIPPAKLIHVANRGRGHFYDWPVQMAAKPWVDLAAFNDAFRAALDHHHGAHERSLMAPSLAEAARVRREGNAIERRLRRLRQQATEFVFFTRAELAAGVGI